MRVVRSQAAGPTRRPPAQAYLWAPRQGSKQGQGVADIGPSEGGGLVEEEGRRHRESTGRKGSHPREVDVNNTDNYGEDVDTADTFVALEEEKNRSNNDGVAGSGGDSGGWRREVERRGRAGNQSERRPITAAVSSSRDGAGSGCGGSSNANTDSSCSPSRATRRYSGVTSGFTVHTGTVIYAASNQGPQGLHQPTHNQPQPYPRKQHQKQQSRGGFNNGERFSQSHSSGTYSSKPDHPESERVGGIDDSFSKGKDIARSVPAGNHAEQSVKRLNKTKEDIQRPQSFLALSSTLRSRTKPGGRDGGVQFYSARYNCRGSNLFSAQSRRSSGHQGTFQPHSTTTGSLHLQGRSNYRPQTARAETSHTQSVPHGRGRSDTRRSLTARHQTSLELTSFKNRLEQQERSRHQPPCSARLVKPRQRSASQESASSPSSSSSSPTNRRKRAPTPNLYRQVQLASHGPPVPKSVQLTSGQQRPVSETVRRDCGALQDSAAERREALSVQRSQSSLSFLGGRGDTTPALSNFPRCVSSLGTSKEQNASSSTTLIFIGDKSGRHDSIKSRGARSKPRTKHPAKEAKITTREPSSARFSVDNRLHSDNNNILDLVGRQPGFLSTLALIPSDKAAGDDRNTPSFEHQTDIDKPDTCTTPSPAQHHANSSGVENLDFSEQLIKCNDSSAGNTGADEEQTIVSSDIYRNHWPRTAPGHGDLVNVKPPQSNATEIPTPNNKDIDLNLRAPEFELPEKTARGSSELRLRNFSGDRHKRNTSGVVTFDLPDDERSSSPRSSDSPEELDQEQTTGTADDHCMMSAPELPPIAVAGIAGTGKTGNSPMGKTPREHKRKTSNNSNHSSGSRASIHQMTNAVNSKTYYNRKSTNNNNNNNSSNNHTAGGGSGGGGSISTATSSSSKRVKKKGLPIPRNHSDSSLKGLLAQQTSSFTGSSGSSNILPAGTDGDGLGGGNSRQAKYLANGSRALSWCATENSGSQLKLETLFEGQNNCQGGIDTDITSPNNNITNTNSNSNNALNSTASGSAKGINGIMNSSIYSGRILASPLSNPMYRTESNTSINNMFGNTGRTSTPPIMMNNSNTTNAASFRSIHNHSALSGHFGGGESGGGGGRKTASVKGGGGGGGGAATDMPPILPPRSVSVNGIRNREDIARLAALNRFGEASVEDGAQVVVDTVDDILARGHLRRSQSENRLHGRMGGVGGSGGLLNSGVPEGSPGEGTASSRLQGGNNNRQAGQGKSLSRNLSVDRLDRLTAKTGQIRSSRGGSYTNNNNNNTTNSNNNTYNKTANNKVSNNTSGGVGRLRKVSSMSAMPVNNSSNNFNNNNNSPLYNNNNNNNNYTTSSRNNKIGYPRSKVGQASGSPTRYNARTNKRLTSQRNSVIDDYDLPDEDTPLDEDDDSIEASARLVEWLNVVNNIEEYDTDPQHTVVDYADEPPQTDTAVHVVYEGH